jgi:hypothetical protein
MVKKYFAGLVAYAKGVHMYAMSYVLIPLFCLATLPLSLMIYFTNVMRIKLNGESQTEYDVKLYKDGAEFYEILDSYSDAGRYFVAKGNKIFEN